jgi:PST family polysaccharide transporter
VIGQTAAVAVYAVVLLWITPFRVRIALDMRAAREVIASGVGFLLQGGVALVKQNLDYLSIGRVMGVTSLGFYSLSFRLAELPYWSIADPVAKVTFPGFARMRHQGEDITVPYLTSLRLVALVACPVGTILAASADPFVRAIYGERWVPMIVPLSILGIWAAVRPVQGMTGWLLNSSGQARISGVVSAITVGPLLVAVVVAVRLGGLEAVAWVMLTDAVVSACLLAYLAQVRTGVSLRLQWAALWHVVVGCAAAWVAAKLGKSVAGGASATIALLCSGFFGFMAYVVTVWLLDASVLRSNVVLVRSVLRRSASSRT